LIRAFVTLTCLLALQARPQPSSQLFRVTLIAPAEGHASLELVAAPICALSLVAPAGYVVTAERSFIHAAAAPAPLDSARMLC
jgi:hypothetical protein